MTDTVARWFALLAAAWLGCGCATNPPGQDYTVPPSVYAHDGITRRAVLVGVTRTATGLRCPGCDVDTRTVAGWLKDREVRVLLDAEARIATVQAAIAKAASGLRPNDLLTILISGHGTQRPDEPPYDEDDGLDEGAVLYDGVWWDDDVWAFIRREIPPCRIELITDTCHAEGAWRRLMRRLTGSGQAPVQLEFGFAQRDATDWAGQLVQFAGCIERGSSMGTQFGGEWTTALSSTLPRATSRTGWFAAASNEVWTLQTPALSTYRATAEFLDGRPLR